MREKQSVYTRITRKSFSSDGMLQGYYWVEGNTSNPPLLLLTGFTGTHTDVLALARLLKKTYFVIIPELPGWGFSPRPNEELTLSYYAKYLHTLLILLKLPNVTICGHCMGATLAIECGIVFPEKIQQIFLVSTPYTKGTLSHSFFSHLSHASKHVPEKVRPLFFMWRSRLVTIPLSFYILKFRSFNKKIKTISKTLFNQSVQDERTIEENWNSLISYDYDKAKHLSMPIHIIYGGKDALIAEKQTKELSGLIPFATVDCISQAGHLPPVETPETLAKLIEKYEKI